MKTLGSLLLSISLAAGASSAHAQTLEASATVEGSDASAEASSTSASEGEPAPASAPVADAAPVPPPVKKAPADRIQLFGMALVGFAGELRGGDAGTPLETSDVVPNVGAQGGASLPLGRWFGLSVGAGARAWTTRGFQEADIDRDWLIDFTARPRFRVVPEDGLSEVYLTAPLGVLLPLPGDDKSTKALKTEGQLGWTAGAALGGNYFLTNDVGIQYELAYQRFQFAYELTTAPGSAAEKKSTENLRFQQVVVSLGLVVAL